MKMPGILEQRLAEKKNRDQSVPEKKRADEKRDPGLNEDQKASGEFLKNEEEEKPEEITPLTEEDIRELEQIEAMMSRDSYLKGEKRKKRTRQIMTGFMAVVCIYLTILIYGTMITEFRYNEKGELAPVEMSVTDMENRNEYITLMGYYLQCRTLYEEVLTLDYRMASGTEDLKAIAPEYEETIDKISSLVVQIEASTVGSKYNQILSMLYTWVGTYLYDYCGYTSEAVTQNNADSENEAIAVRQVVYDNFQLITQNIITLGNEIRGYDLTDIKEWSPEGYIQSQYEGIQE